MGKPKEDIHLSGYLESPESSQVESAIYVRSTGNLIVVFRSGAVYAYEVDEQDWLDYQGAGSKGSFLQTLTVYTKLKGRD